MSDFKIVSVVERKGKFHVLLIVGKGRPKLVFTGNKEQSTNIAQQLAKQYNIPFYIVPIVYLDHNY